MATVLETKIAQFETNLGLAHDIVHGDSETEVETDGGTVPSLAKMVADAQAAVVAPAIDDAVAAKDAAEAARDVAVGAAGTASGYADATQADRIATETARDIAVAAAGESVVAVPAAEIDLGEGGWFTRTFAAGAVAITVTGWPAAGTVAGFMFEMTNAGLADITWPAGWTWAGGVEPVWSTDATDIVAAVSRDGGVTIYAGCTMFGLEA